MPTPSDPKPRRNRGPAAGPDNRRALIVAAREVYAQSGLSAPFSAIAKRAGVGQGSLYRHFPDRTALAVAVFDENIAELEAFTAPVERTLDDLLDRVADQAMVSTALITLLGGDPHDARVRSIGRRYRAVVERLVDRERAAGHLAASVSAEDVLLATAMLAGAISRSDPVERAVVATRARALFRAAFAAGTEPRA
ncbi:TetR family transcriptional regulator [Microbacterium ulmi]|uniref:TetR/AcrR family transcriptional regulator n=1 Tax=Microbacterium ulmi TaxID=179095 RepID=A0A7Y2M144_9MICO|nr:AcrR family transcriptional regulator [Microbacterium ulmi]NNH04581.1 TetR/AcrR family transcriptional regulator [Microbacterium ulmi]